MIQSHHRTTKVHSTPSYTSKNNPGRANFRSILSSASAAISLLSQGVNGRCAIYSPLNAPAGSSCLASLNQVDNKRMVCVSPGAGPVVEATGYWSTSSYSPRGFGFASATRDYSGNIAATLREGLAAQFQPPQARDKNTISELLDTGATFEFAKCGDTTIYVIGDQNSTESAINDQYRDVQAVFDLMQKGQNNPTVCVCPFAHQEFELSNSGSPYNNQNFALVVATATALYTGLF